MKPNNSRKKILLKWLNQINHSKLTISEFFKKYEVPFSRSQYFNYKKQFAKKGEVGLDDGRSIGGNKKISQEVMKFLTGYLKCKPQASLEELKRELFCECGLNVYISTISRSLKKDCPHLIHRSKGRPCNTTVKQEINPMGGFELIIAIAYHLGWPQRVAEIICKEVKLQKKRKMFKDNQLLTDKKYRAKTGKFTIRYNKRKDVRDSKFASITDKRLNKNWSSMNLFRDQTETIIRKTVAILSLPVVTLNGNVRTVNLALGETLKHYCGFNYKQSSLNKFLSELKYLGISANLLQELTKFWFECWGKEVGASMSGQLLCYYIDGNTRALWSSKRVKKNKVTMLGKVMGCLEDVFIHDGLGNPIYFETYSGRGPVGEHLLGMFKKIEKTILKVPGSDTKVCRAIVMDGSSNSVKTLRAFADQDKYYYITTLDDNQWDEDRIISIGRSIGYKHGDAVLNEVVLEMKDSTDRGYLISTRGIKINWDNGKTTVILTSLPREIADASEVVYSYFKRWPCEELQFKHHKKVVSLHRVVGYGKKEVTNENILEKQKKAKEAIDKLNIKLEKPLKDIEIEEELIAKLIYKKRKIRAKCKIEKGKRIIPDESQNKFKEYDKKIKSHKRAIKKIEKSHEQEFKALWKHQKEWQRIYKKEKEYVVDVELDQIVTFHRMGLANLYAYFIKQFLGGISISLNTLVHGIIHLKAIIKETDTTRNITLQKNNKDPKMMKLLHAAIEKMNELNIYGPTGKLMKFTLEND